MPAVGDARYVRLGVHDLYVGLQLYVGRRDLAGAVLGDRELYGLLALELELQALDVEDDVDDVLFDALDRRELVADALYADLGDRGPREPGEHDSPERVAQGVPQSPRQRLGDEGAAPGLFFFHPETGWCYVQHRQNITCCKCLWSLPAVELDDELLFDGRVDLVAARRVKEPAREVVVVGL